VRSAGEVKWNVVLGYPDSFDGLWRVAGATDKAGHAIGDHRADRGNVTVS
jgi:hypothetical protein